MDLSQKLIEHFIPLETICNSILEGVIIVDSSKRFIYWNKSAKEILSDKPDVVDPQDWAFRYNLLDVETEGHLNFEDLPIVKALNGETFLDYRIMVKSFQYPDGMILSVNGKPIRNGLATVAAIVTFREITEEVKLQKDLSLNKEMYERMLDLMPCVVYIKDLDGYFIYANKCLLEIFNTQSVIGQHCIEYLPQEVTDEMHRNDALVIGSGTSHIFTEEVTLRNGKNIHFHSIRFPYRDSAGDIVGVCAVSEVLSDKPSF